MDSVTQAALGAALGHSLLGKQVGRVAPLLGAALGTLPDLDVLIAFGGAVEDFTYHRGFSHSLLVHILATPLLVWLITTCHAPSRAHRNRWHFSTLAILWTHALLDAFTVYGTQLLWPLTDYPFAWSSIFIIDPLYTLPLLLALLLAGIFGWRSARAQRLTVAALALSSLYLCWSLGAKFWLHQQLDAALAKQGLAKQAVLSTPAPFNTLLWRVVVLDDDQYHIGHFTLWDQAEAMRFKAYAKGEPLLQGLETQWDVQRLAWFTKGFYRTRIRDQQVVISDLRMGFEGSYVFNFAVAKRPPDGSTVPHKAEHLQDPVDLSRLRLLWQRLWDANISLHPIEPNRRQTAPHKRSQTLHGARAY